MRNTTMHNGANDKNIFEQSTHKYTPTKESDELHLNSTRVFIHEMDGVVQSIVANAELLKLRYAHKLNREAVSYLQRIEENSYNLVNLFNSFQDTIPPGPAHSNAACQNSFRS